jgi:4-diphosphocytidyl-2-C-methyl-D-erythritol kinase
MDDATLSVGANDWNRVWPAPAKLNLFLHVVGRRPDGYHLLQSVFRLIDCCDWLRMSPLSSPKVSLAQPLPGVEPQDELSVRAARLLQRETGCRRGVEISIGKNIPVGGGLGGGSSDAATTLIALNKLWSLGLTRLQLAELALQLGADVPFFLFGRNAFAEGIGEQLAPLDPSPAWYVVLVPPVSVSTREIFAAPELTRDTKTIKISSFSTGFGHNDLEPVVCRRYPVVAAHLAWLKDYGDARMSGSGACVFCEFPAEAQARAVVSRLPAEIRGFAARGLDRHPLAADLGHELSG